MSEINVDSMIANFEKNEFIDKHKEKDKLNSCLDSNKPKITIKMGRPLGGNEPTHETYDKPAPIAIKNLTEIKSGVWTVLSLPMKNPEKRKRLKENLTNNSFLNSYCDSSVLPKVFSAVNDDLKALCCYGYLYFDAYNSA